MPFSRKIIHIDMDAFFASVEQLDQPELRGRPVIVGGEPGGRGVVAACSYEARVFGVHSAMPAGRAAQLCPRAVFLRPRMDRYREVSHQIMALFHRYTPLVEPLSVDEAFLDVTENLLGEPSATRLAQAIRTDIHATTGLTASAGVSCNKFLAKVASGRQKPDGLTVIPPGQAAAFIKALPIGKFYGVGRVTEEKMHSNGIRTGADLLRFTEAELVTLFGKAGRFFFEIARGRDTRPVEPVRVRKSVGAETTLAEDIVDPDQVRAGAHRTGSQGRPPSQRAQNRRPHPVAQGPLQRLHHHHPLVHHQLRVLHPRGHPRPPAPTARRHRGRPAAGAPARGERGQPLRRG